MALAYDGVAHHNQITSRIVKSIVGSIEQKESKAEHQKPSPQLAKEILCLNCDFPLAGNPFFYTLARNSYMFGFFCSHDCANASDYNKYMHAYPLKINATADSHRELVLIPSLQTLKQYKEESERRELRKKYF